MTHRVRWWVYVDGQRFPHTAQMRGRWDYDATCSCGWDSATGGGLRRHVAEKVAAHKQDAAWAMRVEVQS
jgi:hypothetical protein